MTGVGQTDINRASAAADKARTEVWNCESRVNYYSQQVSQSESMIRQTEHDIQQAASKINQLVARLQELSVKRQVVADIQAKTRATVRQLGTLNDVGSVAEVRTRHLIQLETMVKVMEEMTSALGRITGNQLLLTEGITSLIGEMKKNQMELKSKSIEHSEL